MGNLEETKFSSHKYSDSCYDNDRLELSFLRMGTVGIVGELYGKSDYREIARIRLEIL